MPSPRGLVAAKVTEQTDGVLEDLQQWQRQAEEAMAGMERSMGRSLKKLSLDDDDEGEDDASLDLPVFGSGSLLDLKFSRRIKRKKRCYVRKRKEKRSRRQWKLRRKLQSRRRRLWLMRQKLQRARKAWRRKGSRQLRYSQKRQRKKGNLSMMMGRPRLRKPPERGR